MNREIALPTGWRDALADFHTLVNKITDAYDSLLSGLIEIQRPDGGWPTIYLGDKLTHHWTIAQCLIAILTAGKHPRYFTAAISKLMEYRRGVGWVRGDVAIDLDASYLNVYCTADALWALVLAQQFDVTVEIIAALQSAAGDDFGYGVIEGDDVSKVRTTCWALNALLMAYSMPPTCSLVNSEQLQRSLEWLEEARSQDGGWGFLPKSSMSNPTATSWGIYTILLAKEKGFKVRSDLGTAIDRLNRFHDLSGWRGISETFEITVGGKFVQRHRAAGLGTTAALLALAKAAKHEIIEASDPNLIGAIVSLTNSIQVVEGYPGKWIVPSGLGEERATIWDSCYAMLALHDVTELLVDRLIDVNLAEIEQLADLEWSGVYTTVTELGDAVEGLVDLIEAISAAYTEAVWQTLQVKSPPQLWQRLVVYTVLLAARSPLKLGPTLNQMEILREQVQPIYRLVRFDLVITRSDWNVDLLMQILDALTELGVTERVSSGWRVSVDLFAGETYLRRTPGPTLMMTREARRAHLIDSITKDLSLLKEYEDSLRVAADPRERTRYKQQISEIKNALSTNQRELALLEEAKTAPRAQVGVKADSRDILEVLIGPHTFLRPLRRLIRDDLLTLLGTVRFFQESTKYDKATLVRQCRFAIESEGFEIVDEKVVTSEGEADVVAQRTDFLGSRLAVGIVFDYLLDKSSLPQILNCFREIDVTCEGAYLYIMAPSYRRDLVDELAKIKSITLLQPLPEKQEID